MYDVLIVDDEKYVRLWIRNCVDWKAHGFNIAGEASDGAEALDKIRELKPRLVISDMDMPEMDGSRLIERANQIHPDILFVILSGYNEFEYMRSAVKNNAVDYLLKPVKAEEIIKVLQTVKSKLELTDKQNEERLRAKMAVRENAELLREKFLLSLLHEKFFSLQEIRNKMDRLGISLSKSLFCVITVDAEIYLQEGSVFSIADISSEVLLANNMTGYFIDTKSEIAGIISFNDDGRESSGRVVDTCRQILDSINRFLNLKVVIGVGDITSDVICLGASYKTAQKALELRLIHGGNSVLTFYNSPKNFDGEVLSLDDENQFLQYMMTSDFSMCERTVTRIYNRFTNTNKLNIETIKMVYYRLISLILKAIYDKGITPSYLALDEMDMFSAIKELNSLDQIKDKLIFYIRSLTISVPNSWNAGNSAVEKAKSYIIENYAKEISLMDIANHVHVTPNYFCTLFKTETNQNLFDYIINLRIEKAKALLKDDALKTYEIGEMVGYKEPKYFCRVFKKSTGMSPSEFRKMLSVK